MSWITRTHLLGASLSLAMGAAASGVPLRFENPEGPDRVDWENFFVDITKPASEQPGTLSSSVINNVDLDHSDPHTGDIITSGIGATGTVRLVGESFLLTPLEFGDLIGSGGVTPNMGGGLLFETVVTAEGEVATSFSFPLGRWYIGASFGESIVDETQRHAAWIFFDFFEGPDGIPDVELLAWGYETEPGVPVAAGAPAPGAAAPFVIAGAAALRRRRRSG